VLTHEKNGLTALENSAAVLVAAVVQPSLSDSATTRWYQEERPEASYSLMTAVVVDRPEAALLAPAEAGSLQH
jgi:hypothetical protein